MNLSPEEARRQSVVVDGSDDERDAIEFCELALKEAFLEEDMRTKVDVRSGGVGDVHWRTYREAFESDRFVYVALEGVEFEAAVLSGKPVVVVKMPVEVAIELGLKVDGG